MLNRASLDFSIIQKSELYAEAILKMAEEVGEENLNIALRGRGYTLEGYQVMRTQNDWREAQEGAHE